MSTTIQTTSTVSRFHLWARYGVLALLVLAVAHPVQSQKNPPGRGAAAITLPPLNVVTNATLSPSYSCNHNPAQGYGTTALFLSAYTKQQNSPELLFNGACGSPDYFDVNTNGDEMSLIADLGNTPLASVTAQKAFNLKGVDNAADYTKFSWHANVVQGNTYAAVINTSAIRGLLVFTVVKYIPNQQVEIQYQLKDYMKLGPADKSSGFDWNK